MTDITLLRTARCFVSKLPTDVPLRNYAAEAATSYIALVVASGLLYVLNFGFNNPDPPILAGVRPVTGAPIAAMLVVPLLLLPVVVVFGRTVLEPRANRPAFMVVVRGSATVVFVTLWLHVGIVVLGEGFHDQLAVAENTMWALGVSSVLLVAVVGARRIATGRLRPSAGSTAAALVVLLAVVSVPALVVGVDPGHPSVHPVPAAPGGDDHTEPADHPEPAEFSDGSFVTPTYSLSRNRYHWLRFGDLMLASDIGCSEPVTGSERLTGDDPPGYDVAAVRPGGRLLELQPVYVATGGDRYRAGQHYAVSFAGLTAADPDEHVLEFSVRYVESVDGADAAAYVSSPDSYYRYGVEEHLVLENVRAVTLWVDVIEDGRIVRYEARVCPPTRTAGGGT